MTSTVSATGDVNQIITAAPVEHVKSESDGNEIVYLISKFRFHFSNYS